MIFKQAVLHHRTIYSFLLLVLVITSCAQVSLQVQKHLLVPISSPSSPTLRSLAQAHGIYIGTTVSIGALQKEERYQNIFASEFNMVTPEISMKFDATEPQQDHYTLGEGDFLVAFAKAHNMKRLAALGLEVQITEMDVKIQGDPRPMLVKLVVEAQICRNMLITCLAVKQCTAFVMWGFTDRHSWIPGTTGHPDAPLIFDVAYHPKPAFYALINALNMQSFKRSIY